MKKQYTAKGYLSGIIAAVSYGTNPLFALPMYKNGFGVNSVLFYRYFFAVLIYGVWLTVIKKVSLKLTIKEAVIIFALAIAFSLSSLFLFDAFNYIDSGLACTILFSYPLIVALISKIFFNEKLPKIIWGSLFIILCGIYMLYGGKPNGTINTQGIIFVLISAFLYSVYMVGVKQIKAIKHIKYDKLTFFIMLFGLSVYIFNLNFCTKLQPLNSYFTLFCAVMLALFPTIISLETINIAIKRIGATKTAIIGALEPLTALFFGVLLFQETLTAKICLGIILIIFGVIVLITKK